MADVQHSAILTAECHEPKHITGSTTADAGMVVTPDSTTSGTSELRYLTWEELNKAAVPHIGLNIIGNATVMAITIAADTTLHTSADYDAVTLFTEDVSNAKIDFTFNAGTGEVTCNTTGTYSAHIWMSVSSDTVSTLVGVRYGVGGNYFSNGDAPVGKDLLKNTAEAAPLVWSGEFNLTTADVLTIGLASDKGANITIHEAIVTLRRIG